MPISVVLKARCSELSHGGFALNSKETRCASTRLPPPPPFSCFWNNHSHQAPQAEAPPPALPVLSKHPSQNPHPVPSPSPSIPFPSNPGRWPPLTAGQTPNPPASLGHMDPLAAGWAGTAPPPPAHIWAAVAAAGPAWCPGSADISAVSCPPPGWAGRWSWRAAIGAGQPRRVWRAPTLRPRHCPEGARPGPAAGGGRPERRSARGGSRGQLHGTDTSAGSSQLRVAAYHRIPSVRFGSVQTSAYHRIGSVTETTECTKHHHANQTMALHECYI